MSDSYRYLLGFLNIFIFLVGAVFAVSGCLFKFTSGLLEEDVIKLFNKIKYEGIQLGLVGEGLAFLMIAFGGVLIFLTILGICGVYRKHKYCLISVVWSHFGMRTECDSMMMTTRVKDIEHAFAGFLVFLMIVQLLIVGLWVFYRLRTDLWLRGKMLNSLKNYAGPDQNDLYSAGWNELFMKAQCCGVNDQFKDGGTNSDFTELPTTWTSGTDKVPATCCQGVTDGTISSYINSADCTNGPKNFYSQGCYDRVSNTINLYSLIVFITSGVALFVKIAAIILACLVVKQAINKVNDGPLTPKSKPPPYVSGSADNNHNSRAMANWNTATKAVKRNNFMDV